MSHEAWARVLAAFNGQRFDLDVHGAQALWFAYTSPACDLRITPEHFHLKMPGHHPMTYEVAAGAGVISFFIERVGTVGPRSVRTWVAQTPIKVPPMPGFTAPARHVLVEAWTSRVVVRLRATEPELETELPDEFAPRYLVLSHACPHCHITPDRYRALSDTSLVCMACGRSSDRPT